MEWIDFIHVVASGLTLEKKDDDLQNLFCRDSY